MTQEKGPWVMTYGECTVAVLKQIKLAAVNGDKKTITVYEWKEEKDDQKGTV